SHGAEFAMHGLAVRLGPIRNFQLVETDREVVVRADPADWGTPALILLPHRRAHRQTVVRSRCPPIECLPHQEVHQKSVSEDRSLSTTLRELQLLQET